MVIPRSLLNLLVAESLGVEVSSLPRTAYLNIKRLSPNVIAYIDPTTKQQIRRWSHHNQNFFQNVGDAVRMFVKTLGWAATHFPSNVLVFWGAGAGIGALYASKGAVIARSVRTVLRAYQVYGSVKSIIDLGGAVLDGDWSAVASASKRVAFWYGIYMFAPIFPNTRYTPDPSPPFYDPWRVRPYNVPPAI